MEDNYTAPKLNDYKDDTIKVNPHKIDDVPKCIIFMLNGYIDTYNSNSFQKYVHEIIDAGFINLIFQCNGLSYVSSTGIGSFTSFLKTIRPLGGNLVMLEVRPKVFEVLQLLGFLQFFNIKVTLEDSISFFNRKKLELPSVSPTVFPKTIACPICSKSLKAVKSGHFRCSGCKGILAIDDNGKVLLG